MTKPTELDVWNELKAHYDTGLAQTRLDVLCADDPARTAQLTVKVDGLEIDFSRSHVTQETLGLLVNLAKAQGVEAMRDKMFSGEKTNHTEGRAVLHTALRAQGEASIYVGGRDVIPDIRAMHSKLERFVDDVRSERWLGATGQPIRTIVNIGIGGSDLGPRLVVSALRAQASGPQVLFVANVDAADLQGTLARLILRQLCL